MSSYGGGGLEWTQINSTIPNSAVLNNLVVGAPSVLLGAPSSVAVITGFAAPAAGRFMAFTWSGVGNRIIFSPEDTRSTAANRLATYQATSLAIGSLEASSLMFWYDSSVSRWRTIF